MTKKGQVSVELLVLIGMVLLVFMVISFIISQQVGVLNVQRTFKSQEELSKFIQNEIFLAGSAQDGYRREVVLPGRGDFQILVQGGGGYTGGSGGGGGGGTKNLVIDPCEGVSGANQTYIVVIPSNVRVVNHSGNFTIIEKQGDIIWINISNMPSTGFCAQVIDDPTYYEDWQRCKNSIDDDGDGKIDCDDPGCWVNPGIILHPDFNPLDPDNNPKNPALIRNCDPEDVNEGDDTGTLPCDDRIDNDNDGLTDADDPGCHIDGDPTKPVDFTSTNETHPANHCDDGVDNDGDGYCDFASDPTIPTCGTMFGDPGCLSPIDNTPSEPAGTTPEYGDVECDDGIDNDGDYKCDGNGCTCDVTNNYCGTGNSDFNYFGPDSACVDDGQPMLSRDSERLTDCNACNECGLGDPGEICDRSECYECGNCKFDSDHEDYTDPPGECTICSSPLPTCAEYEDDEFACEKNPCRANWPDGCEYTTILDATHTTHCYNKP